MKVKVREARVVRDRDRASVRVRCFVVTGGHEEGAACTAALWKEAVEKRHLGLDCKGGSSTC